MGSSIQQVKKPFNYKRDKKANRKGDEYTPKGYDACQTPPEAIIPLLPYLAYFNTAWEPATGEGYLSRALQDSGLSVIESDILTGRNFLKWQPESSWDAIITNPPFSLKYKFLARCYDLGKPFALLMPVETLGAKTAQKFFAEYGIELVFPWGRLNYKMPNKGWDSTAQFPTCWFTYGLNVGRELTFNPPATLQLPLFRSDPVEVAA